MARPSFLLVCPSLLSRGTLGVGKCWPCLQGNQVGHLPPRFSFTAGPKPTLHLMCCRGMSKLFLKRKGRETFVNFRLV